MADPAPSPPAPSLPAPSRGQRLVKALVRLVVAMSVVAVAVDLARRFDAADVSLEVGWLMLALVPASIGVLVQVLAWRRLLWALTGRMAPWNQVATVYLDAQMARYTPGKVGLLAVRVASAPALGVTPRVMVGSLFIEILSWAGVGVLVGFVTVATTSLFLATELAGTSARALDLQRGATIMAILALSGLVCLCTVPRSHYPKRLRTLLLGPDEESRSGAETAAQLTSGQMPLVPLGLPLWHVAHWLCWVLAGATLCLGLGASWAAAGFTGGILCLAVVLGFLAVVAPAGAGVREVVISVAAAPVLGPSSALVLGLTARIVSLVADFGCWTVVRLLRVRRDSTRDRPRG